MLFDLHIFISYFSLDPISQFLEEYLVVPPILLHHVAPSLCHYFLFVQILNPVISAGKKERGRMEIYL